MLRTCSGSKSALCQTTNWPRSTADSGVGEGRHGLDLTHPAGDDRAAARPRTAPSPSAAPNSRTHTPITHGPKGDGKRAHAGTAPQPPMTTRHLYLARHGAADAFGNLTDIGRRQAGLLGERLAGLPVDAVWHSPLPRAAASAHELARHLQNAPAAEAAELIDHVPYVPQAAETPPSWTGFLDGYDDAEAASGQKLAEALLARFAKSPDTTAAGTRRDTHEVLVTHAYQIAWLVRHSRTRRHPGGSA